MNVLRTLVLLGAAASAALSPAIAADTARPLFNGKDLSGWKGNPDFWSVRDGAITGQSTAAKVVDANTFLIWQDGQPANFELRLKFRLTAQNAKGWGNSGVQYRSRVLDADKFVVGGYQADIDSPFRYTGMLYEERGRGILMNPGQKVRVGPPEATAAATAPDAKKGKGKAGPRPKLEVLGTPTTAEQIQAALKMGDWNELRIVANGNQLQHYVNGVLTADVTDADPAAAPKSGVIALQMHKGEPMTIQFKDILLKTLP
jgi:hypothetical protein